MNRKTLEQRRKEKLDQHGYVDSIAYDDTFEQSRLPQTDAYRISEYESSLTAKEVNPGDCYNLRGTDIKVTGIAKNSFILYTTIDGTNGKQRPVSFLNEAEPIDCWE